MTRTARIYNDTKRMRIIQDRREPSCYHPYLQRTSRNDKFLCWEERGWSSWKRGERRKRRKYQRNMLRMIVRMERTGESLYTGHGSRIYDRWTVD
jgi:hypothetical protein